LTGQYVVFVWKAFLVKGTELTNLCTWNYL